MRSIVRLEMNEATIHVWLDVANRDLSTCPGNFVAVDVIEAPVVVQ